MGTCKGGSTVVSSFEMESSQNHLIECFKNIDCSEKRRKFEAQLNNIDFEKLSRIFKKV